MPQAKLAEAPVTDMKGYGTYPYPAGTWSDDTDTVAAIAGGLAGALYGYSSIPRNWLDQLQQKNYMEALCRRFSLALRES